MMDLAGAHGTQTSPLLSPSLLETGRMQFGRPPGPNRKGSSATSVSPHLRHDMQATTQLNLMRLCYLLAAFIGSYCA